MDCVDDESLPGVNPEGPIFAELGTSILRRARFYSLTKHLHNFGPVHFFSPGAGCRPRLRVRLHGIGATRQKQLYHLDAPPPACLSQRRTLEKVVANVEAGSGIEQNGGELDTHAMIA